MSMALTVVLYESLAWLSIGNFAGGEKSFFTGGGCAPRPPGRSPGTSSSQSPLSFVSAPRTAKTPPAPLLLLSPPKPLTLGFGGGPIIFAGGCRQALWLLPVLAPAGEVLSLAPEKVPKERVQGEAPLDTPRSVGVRPSITGVAKLAVAQLPSTASGLVRTYA